VVRNADTRLLADETTGATLADATGNGNAATLAGAAALVAGRRGNAVKFSGGHAALPAGIVSGLADFTIAAWVKPESIATWQRIFDFGSSTTSYMFLTTRPSTTGGLRFAITTGSGEQQVNTSATLAVGVWQHVAVTLRGSTATIYLNGTAVGTNTGVTLRPSSLGQSTNNFIGRSQFTADPALAASIDDFRIYSRSLTAAEVQGLAAPDVTLTVAAGQTVTDILRTGGGAVIKDGPGTLVLDKANTHEGGTVVKAGTVIVQNVAAIGSGGLEVRTGATVVVDVGGGSMPLSSLVLDDGAKIDVGLGRLVIAADGTSLAELLTLLVAGRGSGVWDGAGGFVTRAGSSGVGLGLGYLVDDDGSVTIGFAAAGDSNLDGQLDILDAATILGSATTEAAAAPGWAAGDFNYDGVFDVLDVGEFLATGLYDAGAYGLTATAAAFAAYASERTTGGTAAKTPRFAIDTSRPA